MAAPNALSTRKQLRIAIIYNNIGRPDATGEYCRRALEALGHTVSHYLPNEGGSIPPIYDLYLRLDDDLEYGLPAELHPLVYWATDVHKDYHARLVQARKADFVFCAQRNSAAQMRTDGLGSAAWLPLACDATLHRPVAGIAKDYDVSFIQHVSSWDAECDQLAAWFQSTFARCFAGKVTHEEMVHVCNASHMVINCAQYDEIGDIVFGATACGSLLLTNDLAGNGQNHLFTPGIHLLSFRGGEDLPGLVQHFLFDTTERERIAQAGRRHVHAQHTYSQRMTDLLWAVLDHGSLDGKYPVETTERADERQGSDAATHDRGAGFHPNGARLGAPTLAATRNNGVTKTPEDLDKRKTVSADVGRGPSAAFSSVPPGRPAVSIVIPTFNHLPLTQQCVRSIRGASDVPYEVIIVDNGSTDGTASWARGEGLRVIPNPENYGFPRACNQGIRAAEGDSLLLLNNDTMVSPGWLTRLLGHAEKDPRAGLVAPSTNFAGSCQQIEANYNTHEQFLAFAEQCARNNQGMATAVERLIGLCLLIPRGVVQTVGLLDERFGLGNFEDDDYCLRVRMAGFRLLWAQDVFIHHEGHQSFKLLGDGFRDLLERNRRLFQEKWDLGRYFRPAGVPARGNGGSISQVHPEDSMSISGAIPAWDLLRTGRYSEAYDAFEACVRSNPTDSRALTGLGLAAEGRGVPKAAALAYSAVLDLVPTDANASRGLARVAK